VAGAVALLIVGLLTLVALGANGGRPTRHGHLAARPVPAAVQDSWITLLIIAYGFAIVAVLVMMFRAAPIVGRSRTRTGSGTTVPSSFS